MRSALGAHLILTVGTVLMLAPLALVLLGAGNPGGLQGNWAPMADYAGGLAANADRLADLTSGAAPLENMIATSIAMAASVAVVTTLVAFLAAFVLNFFGGRLAHAVFWITLLTLYFPIEARMLATFDVAVALGLINTMPGLVLPILPLAVATFLFRQHFAIFPREYIEAARLDGAGPLRFLLDFAFPLSKAPIMAVMLITFMVGWNQYLWPLMLSTDNGYFPIMRGLNLAGTGSGPSLLLAAVSLLPPLVLVLGFMRALSRAATLRL